ncbi:MAG TPA: dihydrofolate reductase family protein [Gaiellaceae bacterium]
MVKYATSISLDGFTAGVDQSLENPIGVGGMRLHDWIRELAFWREAHGGEGGIETPSTAVLQSAGENVGAHVMGRNMFGGGPGPWGDDPWNGWWGENPPFHVPVFVLTHHERDPLACDGGTTFTFVTDGVESAMAQAKEAAAGRDVQISGGSTVARQALAAGLLDEIRLDLVPVLVGRGVRLFEDGDAFGELEQISAVEGRGVTHLTYRVPAA